MSNLVPFQFESTEIRVITDDNGEPLFVGKDICIALGYTNPSKAMNDHCRGVTKRYPIIDGLGRTQDTRILTEPDVLRMIINSKLPAAEAFERLVFEEILPSIRKSGKYESVQPRQSTAPEISVTAKAMMSMAKAFGFKGNQAALCADRATKNLIGVSPLKLLGAEQIVSDMQDVLLTSTEVGSLIGMTRNKINPHLESLGLLRGYRDPKDRQCWELTDSGLTNGGIYLDTAKKHGDGTPVKQIKWSKTLIAGFLSATAADKLQGAQA